MGAESPSGRLCGGDRGEEQGSGEQRGEEVGPGSCGGEVRGSRRVGSPDPSKRASLVTAAERGMPSKSLPELCPQTEDGSLSHEAEGAFEGTGNCRGDWCCWKKGP